MIKFNLLPKANAQRNVEVRKRNLAILSVLVVVGLLGAGYATQLARSAAAQSTLESAQTELGGLQAQVRDLQPYADLRDDRDTADRVIATVLAGEVSMVHLLESVGEATPRSSWYRSWQVSLSSELDRPLGSEEHTLGRLTLTGTETNESSPGVRNLVVALSGVTGTSNTFLSSVQKVSEDTYTNQTDTEVDFSVELDLTEERLTGRYANGMPAELLADIEAPVDDVEDNQ
jgi:Tfp pilus assembly protein PilN